MIEALVALGDRLRAAGLESDADHVETLRALYGDDRGEFWIRIDEDALWGARRSVAERVAAVDEGEELRACMIVLADGMAAVGIHNARAETWAQSFGGWSRTDDTVCLSETQADFEVEPEDGT